MAWPLPTGIVPSAIPARVAGSRSVSWRPASVRLLAWLAVMRSSEASSSAGNSPRRCPAGALRAADRGQQHRVQGGRVAEADRDGGALELPRLRHPVVVAGRPAVVRPAFGHPVLGQSPVAGEGG